MSVYLLYFIFTCNCLSVLTNNFRYLNITLTYSLISIPLIIHINYIIIGYIYNTRSIYLIR